MHALLSDIFIQNDVPPDMAVHLTGPRHHHNPQNRQDLIVMLADWMAIGERFLGDESYERVESSADAALACMFDQVSLYKAPEPQWPGFYPLAPLSLEKSTVFPVEKTPNQPRLYQEQWELFRSDAQRLAGTPHTPESYFVSITALLRHYTSLMPTSVPWHPDPALRERPDISMYDHARVVAAIAAALESSFTDQALAELRGNFERCPQPVARLYRGDFSGIQSFIYRIARYEDDRSFENVAKGLRGRSFNISLLNEIIPQWVAHELGLPPVNVLYAGGGRFDLLMPASEQASNCMAHLEQQLNDWMLAEYAGEFGLRSAATNIHAPEFGDMSGVYSRLDDQLDVMRNRKWSTNLDRHDFWIMPRAEYDACQMSGLPLKPGEETISDQCKDQIALGGALPYVNYIAYAWERTPEQCSTTGSRASMTFPGAPFQVTVLLLKDMEGLRSLNGEGAVDLFRLNDANLDAVLLPNVGTSFRFIANTAPIANQRISRPQEPVEPGYVLHFDAISELSHGSQLIGILKADVDRLGLIFGLGLSKDAAHTRPTISRLATLSSRLDLFFCGWLNEICHRVWERSDRKQAASELFYITYSGGDDLFIVGPWDMVIDLASELQRDFTQFANRNSNITISAGVVVVKSHFPVQRFAELAEEALEASKDGGRDRITLFDETMTWSVFSDLITEAKMLQKDVLNGNVPRRLVHDLGRIHRQHNAKSGAKPMWTPRLHYALTRRLSPEIFQRIKPVAFQWIQTGHILVPVSYVSLITREKE